MSLFGPLCKHDYELIDKEVKESPYEFVLRKGGLTRMGGASPVGFFDKTISRVFKCKKCNKVWVRNDTI